MSSSYSPAVDFDESDPVTGEVTKYTGRFWFHHTSDTASWQVFKRGADLTKAPEQSYSMLPEECSAMLKSARLYLQAEAEWNGPIRERTNGALRSWADGELDPSTSTEIRLVRMRHALKMRREELAEKSAPIAG